MGLHAASTLLLLGGAELDLLSLFTFFSVGIFTLLLRLLWANGRVACPLTGSGTTRHSRLSNYFDLPPILGTWKTTEAMCLFCLPLRE